MPLHRAHHSTQSMTIRTRAAPRSESRVFKPRAVRGRARVPD
jgi:hypothetical protein